MQITALGGDVERVLQFAHGETPWVLTALLKANMFQSSENGSIFFQMTFDLLLFKFQSKFMNSIKNFLWYFV